jgi:hypothetical protein
MSQPCQRANLDNEPTSQRANLANLANEPTLTTSHPRQRANLANWYFTDFYQFLREGLIKDQSVATFVGYEYDFGFWRS